MFRSQAPLLLSQCQRGLKLRSEMSPRSKHLHLFEVTNDLYVRTTPVGFVTPDNQLGSISN